MSKNPFRYFKTSPEIIQLGVLMYVRFPLSLRNVKDLLHERGINICHESVRLWVDRLGAPSQYPRRKLTLAIPKARAGDVSLPALAKSSEVRFNSLLSVQSLQSSKEYREQGQVQIAT